MIIFFFFSSRRRHTRSLRDWSSDVCSSDLGDDAIVVVGVALGLHERLSAASRAPNEVGAPGIASIEGVDDRLGLQREFVYGPIAVVLDLLRVGPPGIARGIGAVPRVRGGCGVIATNCGLHVREADRPGQAAVADALKFT